MNEVQSDTRYKERLVVLVPVEVKRDIAAAAANSPRDDFQISNFVRRAISETISRERLLETEEQKGAA